MRARLHHRPVCRWLLGLLIAPGLGVALFGWRVQVTVTVAMLIFLAAGMSRIFVIANRADPGHPAGREWLGVIRFGGHVSVVGVAVAATLAFAPSLGLVMAMVVAVLLPGAYGILGDRLPSLRNRPPDPSSSVHDPSPTPASETDACTPLCVLETVALAHAMSNHELCTAWRTSFTALQRAEAVADRARWVATRQVYLDEMEVRQPTALTAWLASGARAASNPGRFLRDG